MADVVNGEGLLLETMREIDAWTRSRGYPPSHRDLAERLGVAGAQVHNRIAGLVARGWVSYVPRLSRSTVITTAGRAALRKAAPAVAEQR